MNAENEIARSYDAVAEEYGRRLVDELRRKPIDRGLLTALEEMAPPGPFVDLGCGTGQVGLFLHQLGRQVFGIDLSPAMVEEARKLCPGPDYRVGNMLALDLEDCSTAGAIAFYSIIHLTARELPTAFSELRRVLMPDGLALLAFHAGDHSVHFDEWWGCAVSLDFYYHAPRTVELLLSEADLAVESSLRRQSGEHEVKTERYYVLVRRSPLVSPG